MEQILPPTKKLSIPSEIADAKTIFGLGLNPSECATSTPALTSERENTRIKSRCDIYFATPVFSNLILYVL